MATTSSVHPHSPSARRRPGSAGKEANVLGRLVLERRTHLRRTRTAYRRPLALGTLLDAKDRLRLGPAALELVVVALRRREHVDDDRTKVEQDPVRLGRPLPGDRPNAIAPEQLQDAVGDGIDLALRAAGADDEVVGEGGQLAELEQHDVGRLLVLGRLDDPSSDLQRRSFGDRCRRAAGRQAVGAPRPGEGVGHVRWVLPRTGPSCVSYSLWSPM